MSDGDEGIFITQNSFSGFLCGSLSDSLEEDVSYTFRSRRRLIRRRRRVRFQLVFFR